MSDNAHQEEQDSVSTLDLDVPADVEGHFLDLGVTLLRLQHHFLPRILLRTNSCQLLTTPIHSRQLLTSPTDP